MKANAFLLLGSCLLAFAACTSSSESANRDQMTANVGIYPPPPSGIQRVRVGVPTFQKGDKLTAEMAELAADQLVSLAANTDRFDVIERNQLDQLLKEQSLEGIVRGGELAAPAQVRGVDYLMFGKITNFKVKAEKTSKGFNLGNLPIPGTGGGLGLFDINDQNSRIQVDVGVDLRLVDPSTGQVAVSNFAEYQRVDSLGAMGVSVLGANAKAEAELEVDADNQGKILRLAIDDCVRKMLPKVDSTLKARAKAAAPAGSAATAPTEAPAGGQAAKFCSGCGKPLQADAKFCAGCGAKTGG
jgi:curli biogenesis system outer membrane secretion channel CsgG